MPRSIPATREFRLDAERKLKDRGSYAVTIQPSATGRRAIRRSLTITVGEVNVTELAAIGAKSMAELTTLTFTVSASDVDEPANTLTYSATDLPAGATFDPATWGSVGRRRRLRRRTRGSYAVTIAVSDGTASDSEVVTIAVGEVNVASELAAIGAKSMAELTTLTFTVSASDVDETGQHANLQCHGLAGRCHVRSGDSGVPLDAGGNSKDRGATPVTIAVSDGTASDSEVVTITVRRGQRNAGTGGDRGQVGGRVDDADGHGIGQRRGRTGQHANLQCHGLAGRCHVRSGDSGVSLDANGTQGPASYAVAFAVSDGTASDSEVVTITVGEVNVAPELAAIGAKSVAELTTLTFTVSASDVDEPANTLTYSATDLPAGATFDPATREFRWTPAETQGPGSYAMTFVVSDGTEIASEVVTITCGRGQHGAELAAIGAKSMAELTTLTFTVSASDVDEPANTLTYSATDLPAGATFDPATREFRWTPAETQGPGSYAMTFVVSDGTEIASEVVTITVGEVNVAPQLAVIGAKSMAELTTLTFTVSASDVDEPANTLTYSATGLPAGAMFDPATGVFAWRPGGTLQGRYMVTFTATDDGTPNLTASETVTIDVADVIPPPDPPPLPPPEPDEERRVPPDNRVDEVSRDTRGSVTPDSRLWFFGSGGSGGSVGGGGENNDDRTDHGSGSPDYGADLARTMRLHAQIHGPISTAKPIGSAMFDLLAVAPETVQRIPFDLGDEIVTTGETGSGTGGGGGEGGDVGGGGEGSKKTDDLAGSLPWVYLPVLIIAGAGATWYWRKNWRGWFRALGWRAGMVLFAIACSAYGGAGRGTARSLLRDCRCQAILEPRRVWQSPSSSSARGGPIWFDDEAEVDATATLGGCPPAIRPV